MSSPKPKAPWTPKRLMPRHHRIMELTLGGMSRLDIARELNMAPESIGLIINSPLFQQEIARRREARERASVDVSVEPITKARDRINVLAERAVERHGELIEHEDPHVAQASANAILDRAFGKAGQGLDVGSSSGPVIVLSAENLQLLAVAMNESGLKDQ